MAASGKVDERRRKTESGGGRETSIRCRTTYEREAQERGFRVIAGVDEVGRGCLFGPVFAAAVVLDPERPIRGLHDSKFWKRRTGPVGGADQEALPGLGDWRGGCFRNRPDQHLPSIAIGDAASRGSAGACSRLPTDYAVKIDLAVEQLPLIDGDARCRAIAAASIVAKVHRDECMARWHEVFPVYNLISNKGYSTPDHKRALREHGPTLLHRFSFEPVRASCTEAFWSGYINEPVQTKLFAASAGADS